MCSQGRYPLKPHGKRTATESETARLEREEAERELYSEFPAENLDVMDRLENDQV